MFKKLFKPKPVDFILPMKGAIIPLESVKDEAFSSKAIGDGFAISFTDGDVYSPVNGEVILVFPSKHAIGIKSDDRNEYLIHIGLDTVTHEGKGFDCKVSVGDRVSAGQLIVSVDHDYFAREHVDMTSPIIITNLNGRKVRLLKEGAFEAKEKDVLAITV